MGLDEMYLENLEEFVNDENRIVTYRWLSTTLKVHVNQAKQMLFAFVKEQRNNKDNDNLFVTYFIAGLSHPVNGIKSLKCMVVPEEHLEAFKSTLSLVTSTHIYSVSNSKIKDDNVLYTADYDSVKENICDSNKYSSIKYPKAKVRSDAEIKSLQSAQRQNIDTPQSTQVNGASKQTGVNGLVSQKPAEKPQKKAAGIAGMFANQAKKTDSKTKSPEKDNKEIKKEEPVKDAKKKDTSSNKKGGVMAFFSKQTGKPNEKSEPVKKEEMVKPNTAKKETAKPSTVKKETSPPPPKRQSAGKDKGKRTKSGVDSDDDSQKKRRRIKAAIIDSSSEEEMDYESPIPSPVREPSPAPESPIPEKVKEDSPKKESPEKTTATETGEKRRKRKRKLVPKTFMDDEGYMVTEKVWESESTDASDVEPPAKKQTQHTPKQQSPQKKKASPKKKSPPSGSTKQAALTSFFKKK